MSIRAIIVTGASRGIGLACVQSLLKIEGVSVVGIGRSKPEAVQALLSSFPANFTYIQGDITLPNIQTVALESASKFAGGKSFLAGIVFNAGILDPVVRIADANLADIQNTLNVNLISVYSLAQKALPVLRACNGRLIFVSSGAAVGSPAGWSAYGMSKAALNMFAQVLSKEEPEVISFALRPGVVDTEMQAVIRSHNSAVAMQNAQQNFLNMHKEGKLLNPEVPGGILARLVLTLPKDFSGEFLSWDHERLESFRV